ncbi:MAG: Type IV pilus assembly protein PilM [Microgenomates group bacterium Gr01-1014_7]|nr:MAG: Type IV pilus assembly protein PilM [Microgenomates group bacterium Gr01-1014_7]
MGKITIGLDLGLSSIKMVALAKEGDKFNLKTLGSIPAPSPGILSDNEEALLAVSEAIKKLMTATKIEQKEVVAALPESKVFTRVIDDLPYLTDSELQSAIRYAAEEFIPMPLSEVNLNWQVLLRSDPKSKETKTIVLVVASPKNAVNKYLKVLTETGLKPRALETETIAVTRSLVGNNPFSPTTMIVQLGAATTDFAVVSKGLIWLTRSISTGGMALTRSLAQHFNFEINQAEEYKKVYGLLEDQLEGKVFEALKPVTDIILVELRRMIQAFEAKYPQNPIKRMVLSGGGAKMPGLVIYFANNLGLEVQEADPWYSIAKDKGIISKLATDAPSYSVAVGLALREE